MDIHLTVAPQDAINLFVNGQLQAQISVGVTDTRETLLAQVQAANAAVTLVALVRSLPKVVDDLVHIPDHVHPKLQQRQAEFLRGMLCGLEDETVPYPVGMGGMLPALPPGHSASYRLGYDEGQAYRRACELIHD